MTKLVVVHDKRFQQHLTPESHPESPRRLEAIDQALAHSQLNEQVAHMSPRMAQEDELVLAHSHDYIERLFEDGEKSKTLKRLLQLDPDTWMSPDSYETAKLAAGAGLVAVDAMADGRYTSSFVAVRPPGHHALIDRPMGFCLFNNIAVAARYAQKTLSTKRIFVIDWDVHHGNGTQAMFYDDPLVFFVSLHQYPLWPPNSGWFTDSGAGEGLGYNLNIPLPAGTGDRGYLKAWHDLIEPVCLDYKPDLILLSAGYDAHQFDPLAQQCISTAGYTVLTQKLMGLARANNAKIVSFLEGGYNTKALAESVLATLRVLEGDSTAREPATAPLQLTSDEDPNGVDERIEEVSRHFSQFGSCLK